MVPPAIIPFVDREREIAALERARRRPGASLIIVFGRRRLGKTRLLSELCRERPSALVYVREGDLKACLRHASAEILAASGEGALARAAPSDVDGFLDVVERFLRLKGRPLLVLDEFQNLVRGRRAVLSALQERWDLRLRETRSTLVLCGSAVGMIQDLVNSPKAPLYGRKTMQLELRPLPLWSALPLIPERRPPEQVLRYAVTGGVPYYLEILAAERRLRDALELHVLAPSSTLYDEPRTSIYSKTREPDRYFTLLEAMADGASRPNEIADRTEIPLHQVTAYLPVLCEQLNLVERRVPVTEKRERSRNSLYRIADPFFRFWFACVAPRKSLLERGQVADVGREAMERLPSLAGVVFEDVARDLLVANLGRAPCGLALDFSVIGGWWNRRGDEVDILALGGKAGPIAAEVKLGIRPVGAETVAKLVAKRGILPIGGPVRLAVLTAGTFSVPARRAATEANVTLIDGNAVGEMMRRAVRGPGRTKEVLSARKQK